MYCEWPLTRTDAEAEQLVRAAAEAAGRLAVVGLQGRRAPEVTAAAAAIAAGAIGEPVAFTLRSLGDLGMVPRPAHRAKLRERSFGAHVLTIPGGHALDLLQTVIGPVEPAWAQLWCAVDEFVVAETGEALPKDAPDNLVVALTGTGAITGTATISQTAAVPEFGLDVLGTTGMLRLRGAGQPQFTPLELTVTAAGGDPVDVPVPASEGGLPPGHPARNLALAYRELSDGLYAGRTPDLPTFAEAAELHALLATIEHTGERAVAPALAIGAR